MSDHTTPMPPAGWYPDWPAAQQLRWWDGAAWTEHVHPMPADTGHTAAAVNRLREEPLVTSAEALRAAAGFK